MNGIITSFKTVIIATILGLFVALLSRANHYVKNPDDIPRYRNGKIKLGWLLFVNVTAILTGGLVAFLACVIIQYYHLVDDELIIPIAGMFGAVGDKIFIMVQDRIIRKTKNTLDKLSL